MEKDHWGMPLRDMGAMTTGQALTVLDMEDERQIRLQKMFGIHHGVKVEKGKDGLSRVVQGAPYPDTSLYRPFESLRDAYIAFSGDSNIQYFGRNVRVSQIQSLATFELALALVCNRLLLQDYDTNIYRWQDVVTSITSPDDFRANTRTRLKYVPDIPDLGMEDTPYTELQTAQPEDEALTYTVNQKGCDLSFTRRVVVNDDIGVIKRAVAQLSRAAWRTLAKRVWNLLINNTVYGADGVAVFNAAHGNLGSAALSASALTAARAAMFAQTEPGGPDLLGLGAGPLMLVIPIQLEATALPLNHAQWLDSSYTLNPWIHRFGKENENICLNPLLTDDNDWYLFDVSKRVGIIEVGFLMGQQYPQVVESSPTLTDAAFWQDRAVYKMRHEYECAIIDYRGASKSVVAG